MSDDAPTERFDGVQEPVPSHGSDASSAQQSQATDSERKSKRMIVILASVGGALLAALVILLVILLTRGDDRPRVAGIEPTASETAETPGPSETPTEVESPTPAASETEDPPPPPTATGPRFSEFNPEIEVGCSAGGPGFEPTRPPIQVSWKTKGTDEAWFVQGTSDAADSGFMQIPLNGSQADFPYAIEFPCNQTTATFTITLVGPDGDHTNQSWTVENTGDVF